MTYEEVFQNLSKSVIMEKRKIKNKKWKGNIKKRFYGEIWKKNCRNALSLHTAD